MANSLLIAGIVCVVASIVGGGVKLLGAEMPVLNSFARQSLLFVVGLAFLLAGYLVSQGRPAPVSPSPSTSPSSSSPSPAPPPSATALGGVPPGAPAAAPPANQPDRTAQIPSGAEPRQCPQGAGLACLPMSSRPVVFADPAAADAAAQVNVRDALSTTQAAAQATSQGARGRDARLCGIVQSNDSSPLGKHLAAVQLRNPAPTDGRPSADCLRLADQFL